ncbi:MAG TPA: FkbM family methyltransferase [Solirubrobacterales bacterium]|jgi:FkbM family methyltransferase
MPLLPERLARKPQYVFHPLRAARRATYRFVREDGRTRVADLPWGLPLEVYAGDAIGFSIVAGGVFDPCVTEALHRLIDPGDVVADVGANIGYMSSLAATRVGADGRVLAFEPHPRVYELLERNAARWRDPGNGDVGGVELQRVALSDAAGEGTLVSGPSFEANTGLASLDANGDAAAMEDSNSFTVGLARLDQIAGDEPVRFMKVDVEGHEADVLRGATELLGPDGIRDIVFEDHDDYPSPATAIVEEAGYELISLDNDLWGLRMIAPEKRGEVPEWPGPSYLATRDPDRARKRLADRGWQVRGVGPGLGRRMRRTRR